MGLFGISLVIVAAVCSFLFIHSAATFGIWILILYGTVAVYQGATGALGEGSSPADSNGIRIKSDRDRGGYLHNLNYLNLRMTNVNFPILIYAAYMATNPVPSPTVSTKPAPITK